jgi:hypothetical protein
MRLMVDWLNPVLAASMRLDQCVAPLGAFSSVSRTTCSTFSSPISCGAPGRASSPSPPTPSAMKRLRQRPTVKPVVPTSLPRPHCLLRPHTPERYGRERQPTGRYATASPYAPTGPFARGLRPTRASSAVLDEAPCLTIEHLTHIYSLFMTQETSFNVLDPFICKSLRFWKNFGCFARISFSYFSISPGCHSRQQQCLAPNQDIVPIRNGTDSSQPSS